ncbi:unnamed protein product [Closterium sp. Naga37s-1]|nr:unnamed protein product [Closterium sp. Naga37s-1]
MLKKKRVSRRGKEGNAAKYTTRNQALVRLQLKLADFRRLCILKGIHPREPKKKTKGAHKTYYHVKDINFLAHEPLLELQRELRAQRKKIRKAKGRLETEKVERLERSMPRVSLDHLVKERYPSFIDAIRDLDDALTMLHLFATLPADATFRIPATRVNNARSLSLEWQAYIARTHSLRKEFVSVKGIYYQAHVVGQPHAYITRTHALPKEFVSVKGIYYQAHVVEGSSLLSLEWQAYITRTHALRKVFVSVKGIYYQAHGGAAGDVAGATSAHAVGGVGGVGWLCLGEVRGEGRGASANALQGIPTDVDFRVMLTFLAFYETLMGFVNFKLYHELRLAYPPRLDPRLEKAAAGALASLAPSLLPVLPLWFPCSLSASRAPSLFPLLPLCFPCSLSASLAPSLLPSSHSGSFLHTFLTDLTTSKNDLYAVMRKLAEAAAAARHKRERKAFKAAAAASAALLGAAPADADAAADAGDDDAAALEGSAEKSTDEGGEEGKAEGEADGAAAAAAAADPAAGEGEGAAAAAAAGPPVDPEKEASEKLPLLGKQATASRMASLQSRLAAMTAAAEANPNEEEEKAEGGAGRKGAGGAEAEEEEEEGDEDDEETRACRRLFKGLVFFLGREVPREPLLFVIRAFGGKASWEGEGAPAPETDEAITHQVGRSFEVVDRPQQKHRNLSRDYVQPQWVVDRPQQKHRNLSRDYVQPQWVFDCANARILLPSAPYAPGLVPPPHLSPFVNHEEEGYLPDYAAAIQRLKEASAARDAAQHKGAAGGMLGMGGGGAPMELEGAHEVRMSGEGSVAVGGGEDEVKAEEAALAAKIAEVAAEEKAYAADLAKELSGVPFSSSLVQGKGSKDGEEGDEGENTAEGQEEGEGDETDEEEDDEEEGEGEEEERQGGAAAAVPAVEEENEEDGGKAAARMLMSRKRRGLYDAMQMGRAKKAAGVALLHERRLKAAAAATSAGGGGGAKGAGAGGAKGAGEGGKKGGQQGKKAKQEKKGWR